MIDFLNLKSYCYDSFVLFLEGKVIDWSIFGLVLMFLMCYIVFKFLIFDK